MQAHSYLNSIREYEVARCLDFLKSSKSGKRLLEIGAGTGAQAKIFAEAGYEVSAVDMESSAYHGERVFPIVDYDGRHLPFPDARFDIVFSSNVLEHIPDLEHFFAESIRVMAADGICVHIVPAPTWRFWTQVTYYGWLLRRVFQKLFGKTPSAGDGAVKATSAPTVANALKSLVALRHGEHGNFFTEAFYYRRRFWIDQFTRNRLDLVADFPSGLFYTGSSLFGPALSISTRERLTAIFGSTCRIYVLRNIAQEQKK